MMTLAGRFQEVSACASRRPGKEVVTSLLERLVVVTGLVSGLEPGLVDGLDMVDRW